MACKQKTTNGRVHGHIAFWSVWTQIRRWALGRPGHLLLPAECRPGSGGRGGGSGYKENRGSDELTKCKKENPKEIKTHLADCGTITKRQNGKTTGFIIQTKTNYNQKHGKPKSAEAAVRCAKSSEEARLEKTLQRRLLGLLEGGLADPNVKTKGF